MPKIHWLGAGLSSVPGIRRLATNKHELILWNRTLAKSTDALQGLSSNAQAQQLDWGSLSNQLAAGDIVVSMLPATMHIQVAEMCLRKSAHFVSSSYVSPEMKSLDSRAIELNLCFVNEVGLDPGLDHLMAHVLISNYKQSASFDASNSHYFRSYCGGFPKHPNEFKYKFSWSPLGVLRALKSPAKWIAGGQTATTEKPWTSITDYNARLPSGNETFQAYPNRDSLPFVSDYQISDDWNLQEFVRGTLRLEGWSDAWKEIFQLVENADGEAGAKALQDKSDQLWEQFRYDDGEPDRVVLSVELQVDNDGETVWHQVVCLDESGNANGSAMARLVSLTTSIAVESVLSGEFTTGVSAAPKDPAVANQWLDSMRELGETIELVKLV